ncbi:MAG: phage/plasmid primase, P4 family, partial [Candidatus Poribacteria bacterium]
NYVNLPLFGKDVKEGKTVFVSPENSFKPFDNQWELLQNIVKVIPNELQNIIVSEELETPEEELAPATETKTDDYADMLPCVPKMMSGVSEGCRDVVAFTLAKHFRIEKKFPQEATLAILKMWNEKNKPPLGSETISKKVISAYTGRGGKGYSSLGCDNDLIKPFCDKDNCPVFKKQEKKEKGINSPYFRNYTFLPKRLADDIMRDNRFIYAGEQLYRYDSGVYRNDGERFVEIEAQKRLNDESRHHRIAETIYYIQIDSHTPTEKLNTKPNLINLENGLYDWIEGELLPHEPDYLSTIRIPVKYDPEATCSTVDYFFESTLPADCVPIAEELFGYALIPYVRFEKAFMFTGSGANGKSTFLTLLEAFVGSENVAKIPLQELDEHRFKRADLFGKLINLFADLDARALRSSTYFKTIVSGDMIDAERKHKDPFYFRPFARLAFSANELPQSPDTSYAYFRRWCIIPFPNRFEGANEDKSLADKLTQPNELSGLLNRALKGLERLFKNEGFTESMTIKNSLEDYKRQNDTVAAFVNECCLFDSNAEVERGALYSAYTTFCENDNFKAISRRACYDRIRAHAQVDERRESNGTRYFTGIRIKQSQ